MSSRYYKQELAKLISNWYSRGILKPSILDSGSESKCLYEISVSKFKYGINKALGDDIDVKEGLVSIVDSDEEYIYCTLLLKQSN